MGNFYIEYDTGSGTQTQSFTTGADLRQFIMDNKTTFINHCKVVAKLPEITDCDRLFNSTTATSVDLSEFNTSNVTTMYRMFMASNLKIIDISNFDITKCTTIAQMFRHTGTSPLETIYCNDDWSGHTHIVNERMFTGCNSLVGAVPFDGSNVRIAMANPTTGYFTIKQEPTGIGRLLFNSNEFKTIMFENKEYKKIILEDEIIWSKSSIL